MTLQGVLNGIDIALWDPAKDPLIAAPFIADQLDGKALCKRCRVSLVCSTEDMAACALHPFSDPAALDSVCFSLPT